MRWKCSTRRSFHPGRIRNMNEVKIGNVRLKNKLILAPMAGVSDLPFRLLCVRMGAGLVCTEMVSAKAVTYHNRNTQDLLKTDPQEQPVSLQLFGSEPETIAQAARMLKDLPFALVDLNMGCPVPKVVNNGEGSALMKQPQLAGEIIRAAVENAGKPVTVKIRKGFDDAHVNAVEIALIAQEAGAAAIAVHGRTRQQFYAGCADWDIIRQVKEAVQIPVIGNGDITDGPSAVRMLEETGCDAVMIGRAARGNPWLLSRILQYMQTGVDPGPPDTKTLREVMLEHAAMQIRLRGEMAGIREMRAHAAWYTAGYPGSARLRAEINRTETFSELEMLLTKAFP